MYMYICIDDTAINTSDVAQGKREGATIEN